MALPAHMPHLFRWKRITTKTPEDDVDTDQWKKRVEKASEFAVSEVFPKKRQKSAAVGLALPQQEEEQAGDCDDSFSEAQDLLSNWLSNKLRIDLEMDLGVDLTFPSTATSDQPTVLTDRCFDDLYNSLVEGEEERTVNSVLQDLMKQEVLDPVMMEKLTREEKDLPKKLRNPILSMEARHRQVRENKVLRDTEKEIQRREQEAQRAIKEEARRLERERERRRKKEQHRQEELMQQVMVRLRREMEERRVQEQLARQRIRKKLEQQAARNIESTPNPPAKPPSPQSQQSSEQNHREHLIQAKLQTNHMKCLQSHFSAWYSSVLDRKLRMSKAAVFCNWRRRLRVWRAWRAVVWSEQKRRELERTEAALRTENRHRQLAVESDQRRRLRRCLTEWQVWSRREKARREMLARHEQTKQKMLALLSAASQGKLRNREAVANPPPAVPPEPENKPETTEKSDSQRPEIVLEEPAGAHQDKTSTDVSSKPRHAWQVSKRHTAPTREELQLARQKVRAALSGAAVAASESPGGRFEKRHAVQRQIISQQRKLLMEQQEQITRLREKQNTLALKEEMEKSAEEVERATQLVQTTLQREIKVQNPGFSYRHLPPLPGRDKEAKSLKTKDVLKSITAADRGTPGVAGEPGRRSTPLGKAATRRIIQHPIITAMEARAQQRAERKRQIEDLKRKKEEEKMAEMKAAEERRLQEEEEEKQKAAERRREERRLEREREEEKQRQLIKQREQSRLAHQHYNMSLLRRRGLAPWKRLIQIIKLNKMLAAHHHRLLLLRFCTLQWRQAAKDSQTESEARAEQLQQQLLLQKGFRCFMRLRDLQLIQEERAKHFHRTRTLRRFLLALLDYVSREKLVGWDRRARADEHNNRRLRRRCFLAWRQLPRMLRRERERDARREKLIRRVAEVLLDFRPHPSESL